MRVARKRTAEWKLYWRGRGQDHVAYLGHWHVGEVVRRVVRRQVTYVAHMHVPGINGPVATEQSVLMAKSALLGKLADWMSRLGEEPVMQEVEVGRGRRVRGG